MVQLDVSAVNAAIGPDGTLVMPAQSGGLTDPAGWSRPPVPPEWWDEIRAGMPAYDPRATPCRGMGAIPDCFRVCADVLRSAHPTDSFAARGPRSSELLDPHPLPYGVGEGGPLTRLYDAAGHVLLLGVGHGNNTTLHLAEHRSGRGRETLGGSPVLVDGARRSDPPPPVLALHAGVDGSFGTGRSSLVEVRYWAVQFEEESWRGSW